VARSMKRKFRGADDLELGRAIIRTLGDIASPDAIDCLTVLSRARPRTQALRELKTLAGEVLPLARARVESRKRTGHLLHTVESTPSNQLLLRPATSIGNADVSLLLKVPDER